MGVLHYTGEDLLPCIFFLLKVIKLYRFTALHCLVLWIKTYRGFQSKMLPFLECWNSRSQILRDVHTTQYSELYFNYNKCFNMIYAINTGDHGQPQELLTFMLLVNLIK
jgi:hypothetical protein